MDKDELRRLLRQKVIGIEVRPLQDYDSRWDEGRPYEDDDLVDGVGFADPGGESALRAETPENPRIFPCPTCLEPNRLTPIDVARGYQCDRCADAAERGVDGY